MSGAISIHPKGTPFVRVALAIARSPNLTTAADFAQNAWGPNSAPAIILRSSITAGSLGDTAWAGALADYRSASADFVEALRPTTILGKISGYRRAPMRTRMPRVTAGSTVAWVGERGQTPMSAMALDTIQIENFKISGIVVTTKELAEMSTPAAEGLIRSDLLAAVAALSDRSLVDPANAGETGVSPASISYGASTVASSGSTAAAAKLDMKRLFTELTDAGIRLDNPVLVTDRRTAIAMTFFEDDFFRGITVNGGVIGGVPLVTSASYPTGLNTDSPPTEESSIIAFDASELIVADENVATIDLSRQGTLEFESATPTASTVMVSLWQRNMVAWKVTRAINWTMRRPNAVAVLTGVDY